MINRYEYDSIDFSKFSDEDLLELNRLKKLHKFILKQSYRAVSSCGRVYDNYDIITIHLYRVRVKIENLLIKYYEDNYI